MITGVIFADINEDATPDLVINGEWMPIRFFENKKGRFTEMTATTGLDGMHGQWRSLIAADIDKDGDLDFVAGNLGNNNKFHITPQQPMKLYAGDFDNNNAYELIPAYYIKNNSGNYTLFPAIDRMQLADQLPSIKKKYLLSADYAKASITDLLSNIHANDLVEQDCETTTTVWIENLGKGKFQQHALPIEAQFAPVNAIVAEDIDGDGYIDLLLAGNEYGTEFTTGRYDASYGIYLKGNGKGKFTAISPVVSGFIIDGDVRTMKLINHKNNKEVLVGLNNEKLKCFQFHR